VLGFNGSVCMTDPAGMDPNQQLMLPGIINVQGDLPFIHADTIRRSLEPLMRDTQIPMGTACTPIVQKREFVNRNVVKVVTDGQGFASYFSRAPIPYWREHAERASVEWGKRHLGVYVYRREFYLKEEKPVFVVEVTEESLLQFPAEIRSIPSGADLFVDQRRIGETPYFGKLPIGKYQLTLRKEGYFESSQTIAVDINMPFKSITARANKG